MLFTGSGRHRRPTQTEKVIAVAGVAGVGIALPLLTATGAHAAPVSTWDKVAQCESGGDWGINTGNGFYGGLQFTPSTWKAFGGQSYAGQAHQASKGQQIAVAEKVLASQGPGAWPVCSVKAGLTRGGSAAEVDTGSAARASRSETRATAPTAVPSKPAAAPSKPAAAPSTKPATETPAATAAFPGKAGYDQATGKYWYQKNGGWYWTSHQSVYNQVTGQGAAAPKAAATSGYTVKSGDTLSDIAAAHGLAWQQVYQANQSVIGGNPDLILPGQVLQLG